MALDGAVLGRGREFVDSGYCCVEEFGWKGRVVGGRGVGCVEEDFEGPGEVEGVHLLMEMVEDFEGLWRRHSGGLLRA